jgi:hypothetical protein
MRRNEKILRATETHFVRRIFRRYNVWPGLATNLRNLTPSENGSDDRIDRHPTAFESHDGRAELNGQPAIKSSTEIARRQVQHSLPPRSPAPRGVRQTVDTAVVFYAAAEKIQRLGKLPLSRPQPPKPVGPTAKQTTATTLICRRKLFYNMHLS